MRRQHIGSRRFNNSRSNRYKRLLEVRKKAHFAFDPIWENGLLKRNQAYAWLAEQLGIDRGRCHIRYFNIDQCTKVVEICRRTRNSEYIDWLQQRKAS